MRDFIGGVLILFGVLSLIGTIIGVLFPEKFAPAGQPIPTKTSLFWGGIISTLILLAVGAFVLPNSNGDSDKASAIAESGTRPKTNDIELVQSTFIQIRDLENLASNQEKELKNQLIEMTLKKQGHSSENDSVLRELCDNLNGTLDKSSRIVMPELVNADAKRHLFDAIDAHKKWAIVQKTKLDLFTNGDLDSAQKMAEQADHFAEKEAISMAMAFKAVGAPLP